MPTKAKVIHEQRRAMRKKFIRCLAEMFTIDPPTPEDASIVIQLRLLTTIKSFKNADQVEIELEDFLSCRSETCRKSHLERHNKKREARCVYS